MSKRKVLIYGGCVSRDIFNFDTNNNYEVVAYHARSSLATLSIQRANNKIPTQLNDSLKSFQSNFQRRMVQWDYEQKILKNIVNLEYDFILMDLVGERFSLASYNDGLITLSNELRKSGLKFENNITTYSDEYLSLWKQGCDNFLNTIPDKSKIYIQCPYWTLNSGNGTQLSLKSYNQDTVDKQNNKLSKLYGYLRTKLESSQFIFPDDEVMYISDKHQWGEAPFHYIDEYYLNVMKKLP